jgi:hypothetical protein
MNHQEVYGLGRNGSLVQMVKELKALRKVGYSCEILQSNGPERVLIVDASIGDRMADEIHNRIIKAKRI